MKLVYKIIRSVLVTGIVTFVSIYVMLFLILSIPKIQNKIKNIGEEELSKLLHTEAYIGSISISPFNKVVLYDVLVTDQLRDTLLNVDKLGAGISIYNLIIKQKLVFTYAEIIGLDGHINKPTPDAPTNLQFIIDALSPKDKKNPPAKFDIKIYNVVLRKCNIKYDVLSEDKINGKFDKNHISINNLTADISLPKLKNEDFGIIIKRLALQEKSGFKLNGLTADAIITNNKIEVSNLQIELPHSAITPEKIVLEFNSLKTLGKELTEIPLNFSIANSYITPIDLAGFVPALGNFTEPIQLTLSTRGTLKEFVISVLNVSTSNQLLSLNVSGTLYNLDNKELLECHIPHIDVTANAPKIANLTAQLAHLSPKIEKIIANCGNVRFDGSIKGSVHKANFVGALSTALGVVNLNGNLIQNQEKKHRQFEGKVSTNGFQLGTLISKTDLLQEAAFDIILNATQSHGKLAAKVDGDIKYFDFKGYRYSNVIANVDVDRSQCEGSVTINDKNVNLDIKGLASLEGKNSKFYLTINASDINLANLNIYGKYPDNNLSFLIDASFIGNNIDNADGTLSISDIKFVDTHNKGVNLNHFFIEAHNNSVPQTITLNSDVLNGSISGEYDFKCLVPALKEIVANALPALFPDIKEHEHRENEIPNNFNFNFTIVENNQLTEFFNAPVRVIYPINLHGFINESSHLFNLNLNAPYIQQKNKLIENSSVIINIDQPNNIFEFNAHTLLPSKKGNIALAINAGAAGNRLDTDISWQVDRSRDFHGALNLSTLLNRDAETNEIAALVDINNTELVFNDTVWNVNPAKINVSKTKIEVSDFNVNCEDQFVKINGTASHNSDDKICVELQDINLNYVFETLEISNVTFGGRGTGKFYASEVFTKTPKLATPGLHVIDFSYNNAVLGIADIESHWDVDTKGIAINADIKHANGYASQVNGAIYPIADSIYLDFYAHKLDIGFLKPFLANITSDIQGTASGHLTLFGSLKNIDLKGAALAEDLKIKIDFTNTYYTTTDSVKLQPGEISFKNITLKDKFGNSAKMTGMVKHSYFREASFDFAITNANNLLCFDITPKINPKWYGSIFGNGSVFIIGEPGVVNIDVNMATAANSKFSFVLSDSRAASDYKFITIVDRNKSKNDDLKNDSIPDFVNKFKEKQIAQVGTPSRVNLNIQVEATPLAQLNLIMDPVGGDKIKAVGNGNLRLTYNSIDDEMRMFGNYKLDKGNYNFTLQDIIIKDFTIREGSTIGFNGDPMSANLDIAAIYAINANLTDLDESFAQDKDLNRTNVPVHALLNVKGDIKQPTISFDLELPTLTQDAYRKVKSIISTEDMMNRQIIYLLALNRFYTPEYMGSSANKNNELASVASSTISSQLSSMLGQLSENWSISPNFRTDKGDFSDMEVELALSSQLLNNRLLLNGNFGYRDNKLNASNTNFIGDFDIEYLLTKSGNFRLKAYNHYNDQNYYIKSALTTQGVGIVIKHDFDRLFDFLRKPKRSSFILFPQKRDSAKSITDSVKTQESTLPIK